MGSLMLGLISEGFSFSLMKIKFLHLLHVKFSARDVTLYTRMSEKLPISCYLSGSNTQLVGTPVCASCPHVEMDAYVYLQNTLLKRNHGHGKCEL